MGNEPRGEFYGSNSSLDPRSGKDLSLLIIGALCHNASLQNDNGTRRIMGVPTEGALMVAALKAGFEHAELEKH